MKRVQILTQGNHTNCYKTLWIDLIINGEKWFTTEDKLDYVKKYLQYYNIDFIDIKLTN